MLVKEFEDTLCPVCKKGRLKMITDNAFNCSVCDSILLLALFPGKFTDDLGRHKRTYFVQKLNPDYPNRIRRLYSEGKDDTEVFEILEKEGILPVYPQSYMLGSIDYEEVST